MQYNPMEDNHYTLQIGLLTLMSARYIHNIRVE